MATWHFHSSLLPRVPFEERHGVQTAGLPQQYDGNDWADKKLAQAVLLDVSHILPENANRGEYNKVWGNSAANSVHADFLKGECLHNIYFCVYLRTLPIKFPDSLIGRVMSRDKAPPTRAINFIKAMLHIAQRHDLLFVAEGRAVPPQIPALAEALKSSMAFRYVSDPEDFLNRLKQIQ